MNVPRYFIDTPETLRHRIVWIMKSLPEYVYIAHADVLLIPSELPLRLNANDVLDVWSGAKDTSNLVSLLSRVRDFSPDIPLQGIITLWALHHFEQAQEMYLQLSVADQFGINMGPLLTAIDRQTIQSKLSEFKKKSRQFAFEQSTIRTAYSAIKHIRELEGATQFTHEYITQTRIFSFPSTLFGVFDRLHVSKQIPLITFSSYYKILKDYIPPYNWLSDSNAIVAKIHVSGDTYRDLMITADPDSANQFLVQMDVYEPEDHRWFNTVLAMLPNHTLVDTTVSNIGGDYTLPLTLNFNILNDIVTVSPITQFYKLLSFNDNISNVQATSRHLFFGYDGQRTDVHVVLTNQVSYVNVHVVQCKDEQTLMVFRQLLNRVMTVYKEQYSTITTYYNKILQLEEEEEQAPPKQPSGKKFMKDFDSAIFTSAYTRKCQPKSRIPVVIDDGDIENYDSERLMRFPKTAREGVQQRWYLCTDPAYPHPGLVANTDSTIGYSPCCFSIDQKTKTKSKWSAYFSEEVKENVQPVATVAYIKRTDKIITENALGFFPEGHITNDIGRLNTFTSDTIMRLGVHRSPNAFLECVLVALGLPLANLQERRRTLGRPALAMQQMYDWSEDDIVRYLESDSYLDPFLVLRLVEVTYNCNILLFAKNDEYPAGSIALPRHIRGYCRTVRDDTLPSVFVFVHMGSLETDRLQYPHCELIVHPSEPQMSALTSESLVFRADHRIYSLCWGIFDTMATTYYRNRKSVPTPYTLLNAVSQSIDGSGKVRGLRVAIDGTLVDILTSPLAPLNIPLVDDTFPQPLSKEQIRLFLMRYQLRDVQEHQSVGEPWYTTALYKDICTVSFLQIQLPSKNETGLSRYITNERTIRYLLQWAVFLLSQRIADQGLENVFTENGIRAFVDDTFAVIEGYPYGRIGERFLLSDATPGIMQGGRIVCTSENLVRRIIYQLRFISERYKDQLLNAHKKTVLDSFYVSVNDFTRYPSEIILYEPDSLRLKTLLKPTLPYTLATIPHVQRGWGQPYFYQHDSIVSLSHQVDSAFQAAEVSAFWYYEGYMPQTADEANTVEPPVVILLEEVDKDGDTTSAKVAAEHIENPQLIGATLVSYQGRSVPIMNF